MTPEEAMKFVCDFVETRRQSGETNNQVLARVIQEMLFELEIASKVLEMLPKYTKGDE